MGDGSGVSPGGIATATLDSLGCGRLSRCRMRSSGSIWPIPQMVVVTDHDSKVLARRRFRCRAWDLRLALDWAADRAAAKRFAGATVACEPTGHRWRVLGRLAGQRLMPFVYGQPMLPAWARRGEDLSFDKTDEKDAG